MNTTTTGVTGSGEFLTIRDIERSLELLAEKAVENKEWVLMSPTGMIYRGKAEEMIHLLVPHHPLMTIRPKMYERTSYDNAAQEARITQAED
jgi:hypothetical protein